MSVEQVTVKISGRKEAVEKLTEKLQSLYPLSVKSPIRPSQDGNYHRFVDIALQEGKK